MQTLTQTKPHTLRETICLNVAASFVRSNKTKLLHPRCVPPVCLTVHYDDNRPVTGLASENFSISNAEGSLDLAPLFCVTAFASLPEAGMYEIVMNGSKWGGDERKNHCCVVQVTRVARSRHAIEIGRVKCCI